MLIFKKIFICDTILISWVLWRIYLLQEYEIDKIKLRCKELNIILIYSGCCNVKKFLQKDNGYIKNERVE